MCTASWYYSEDGSYSLFFNRDESRLRSLAQPPELFEHESVRYHCPIDPDGNGTWISSNQYGFSMCLLNHYESEARDPVRYPVSRGQLLLKLATCRSAHDFIEKLYREALSCYRAFTLLALDFTNNPVLMYWDMETLQDMPGIKPPLTSSSWQPESVCAYRIALFNTIQEEQPASVELFENYHHMHDSASPESSPWMVREEAHTVSYTRVDVGCRKSVMSYSPVSAKAPLSFNPPIESFLSLSDA